jgi:shikimate dehydrogenase
VPNKKTPVRLGLLGFPIAHSKSPGFAAEWALAEGISGVDYPLFETPEWPIDRQAWWDASGRPMGFNVTLPFKEQIGAWMDVWTPDAEAVGAINTVAVLPSGKWMGHNTDADGFWESLPAQWRSAHPGKGLLLGAGGAARAVHHALTSRGWTVEVVYRSQKPAWAMHTLPWDALKNHPLTGYALLVQATPLGSPAFPDVAPEMAWNTLDANTLAMDLVYHPSPTPWMSAALQQGAAVQDGVSMLRAQSKKAWEFWKSSGVIPEI